MLMIVIEALASTFSVDKETLNVPLLGLGYTLKVFISAAALSTISDNSNSELVFDKVVVPFKAKVFAVPEPQALIASTFNEPLTNTDKEGVLVLSNAIDKVSEVV